MKRYKYLGTLYYMGQENSCLELQRGQEIIRNKHVRNTVIDRYRGLCKKKHNKNRDAK